MTLDKGHSQIIMKPRFMSPGGVFIVPAVTLKTHPSVVSTLMCFKATLWEKQKSFTYNLFNSTLLVFCNAGF